MTVVSTDSGPILRRRGYTPVPEQPFTGPTSIAHRLAVAPPVSVEAVLAREEHREPADPRVEDSEVGLRAPRLKCNRCGHAHGLHEVLRRGDRCTRCRCQGYEPEHVLPETAEEERRGTRWLTVLGYGIVAVTSAFVGAGMLLAYQMVSGVLP